MKTTKPDISLPAMAAGRENQHPATTSGYIKALKKLSQRRNSVIGFTVRICADLYINICFQYNLHSCSIIYSLRVFEYKCGYVYIYVTMFTLVHI